MSPTRHDLRAHIVAHPGDIAARQVYADVLTARGDPRGAFITAQCLGLEAASAELRERHRRALVAPLSPNADVTFHNGFIERWHTSGSEFQRWGACVLRGSPLRSLRVDWLDEPGLAHLLETSGLERLDELELANVRVSPWDQLAQSRRLTRLRRLTVSGVSSASELRRFEASALRRQLERLSVNRRAFAVTPPAAAAPTLPLPALFWAFWVAFVVVRLLHF